MVSVGDQTEMLDQRGGGEAVLPRQLRKARRGLYGRGNEGADAGICGNDERESHHQAVGRRFGGQRRADCEPESGQPADLPGAVSEGNG